MTKPDLLPEHEMIDLRIELDSISPEYAEAHCFPAMRYFAKKYFDEHRTHNKPAEVDLDARAELDGPAEAFDKLMTSYAYNWPYEHPAVQTWARTVQGHLTTGKDKK